MRDAVGFPQGLDPAPERHSLTIIGGSWAGIRPLEVSNRRPGGPPGNATASLFSAGEMRLRPWFQGLIPKRSASAARYESKAAPERLWWPAPSTRMKRLGPLAAA